MPEYPLSDPTPLITSQLQREIAALKELMQSQLDAIEKSITIAHEDLVRVPTDVQKQVGNLRELHDARFHEIDKKLGEIDERLERKRASITSLLMDVSQLQTQADGSNIRLNEAIQQTAANATAVARLTSEAIAARDAMDAANKCQQEAIAKADTANEKRFQNVNEFRAQLGDQARTFMPRAEVEVMLKSFDSRLDKIEGLLNERIGQKAGMKEGWGWAAAVIALVIAIITVIFAFRPG